MQATALREVRWNEESEDQRLAALAATGIMDTGREAFWENLVRLAGEYFQAHAASIGFADQSRVWMKALWGLPRRELPRQGSTFELVLEAGGAVVCADLARDPRCTSLAHNLGRAGIASFVSVPVRDGQGQVLGALTIYGAQAGLSLSTDQLRMLEGLAEMAAGHLELRRLRLDTERSPDCDCDSAKASRRIWPTRADLRHALERKQFVLHYQPEIDLETRRIVGLEALIRWQHPERGLLPPADFIPQAEKTGMILPIGDWGLAEACRQIGQWRRFLDGGDGLHICVNLSARQFSRVGLSDHVEALLDEYSVSSRHLGLEMTESSLIPNHATARGVLDKLHRLGVSLLLDDFGTGYSSLNHLHNFPFDVLKIDRSFVMRLTEDEQAYQIVRTIVDLASVLRMHVVAEGIETVAQFRMLRQLGCGFGQGFLFARPMPPEAVTGLLNQPGGMVPEPEFDAAMCGAAVN